MYHAAADYAAKKYLEWEKLSYKVENTYTESWRMRFWRLWFRFRWVQHALGQVYWIEMGDEAFDRLSRAGDYDPVLVDRVADRLVGGWENLGLILWATDWNLDIPQIIEILKIININHVTVNGRPMEEILDRLVVGGRLQPT
jgi:hypothetical protein